MRRTFGRILLCVGLAVVLASCGTTEKVPITGRTHKISASQEQQILSLSAQEYRKYLSSAKKSTNTEWTNRVVRVGTNLAHAVENYLVNNGYASQVKDFNWEFNLVQDTQANAFCMPGGKIVVYEGLFAYATSDDQLAVVLGHEIAHAVAKHSAEQYTKKQNQSIGVNIGSAILGAVTGSSDAASIASQAASTYFSFKNLKYSRDDELEADHLGIIFAAMAGYDPRTAIPFWQRMATKASATNELMSTHPSDAHRIEALQKEMPEALAYYKPSVKSTSSSSVKKTTKIRSRKTSKTKRRR